MSDHDYGKYSHEQEVSVIVYNEDNNIILQINAANGQMDYGVALSPDEVISLAAKLLSSVLEFKQ